MVCALTFAAPWQLGWFTLLPLLWWLALPPRPRRQQWTAHLAQWQAAHAALRRQPPRLRGLRLVLLATAASCAIVAGAGPVWRAAPGPSRLTVLLDASASMAARGSADTSAFARADQRLGQVFDTLPPHVDVTLLRCGGPRLRRLGAAARARTDLGVPAGTLDVDLPALAAAVAAQPDTVVWTLTDGQAQAQLPTVGALTVLPAAGPNAAITAVRTVDRWPLPGLSLAVDLVACTDAACRGTLRADGALAAAAQRAVELAPGVPITVAFELERSAAGGELRLQLDVQGDVLAADDAFRAWLPPLPAPRIGVLAAADTTPFAALAARALADEVGGSVVDAATGTEVGFLLVDGGVAPVAPGRVRALTFGSRLAADVDVVPWLQPRLADWDRTSPLCQGLDLSELRIDTAFRGVLPAGAPFLWGEDAAGDRTPLAVLVDGGATASVHFAFRLQDGNLPLLAAFPQLLRRAFVRCHGAAAALVVTTPPPAPGEQDLRTAATAPDRPLPPFRAADRPLAAPLLLAGLLALVLRAFVR
ncbi:MAG: hypothetical protein JNL08_21195 [Planctomycetes bacterium]|nr:hypothetical protein [Planctomycetota bacterium]